MPPNDQRLRVGDLTFTPLLSAADLQGRVAELGAELREQLQHGTPYYLIMLKGAFMFGADLVRAIDLRGEVGFVRLSSYAGTRTSRTVKTLLGPVAEEIEGRDVVLIEDIVDSGLTMHTFLPRLHELQPASVRLVTLLDKPEAREVPIKIDLAGFQIAQTFVVGYGLDYDGLGRGLPAIYQLEPPGEVND